MRVLCIHVVHVVALYCWTMNSVNSLEIDVSDVGNGCESEALATGTPREDPREDKKRKGSPLNPCTIKKHNSLPDLSQEEEMLVKPKRKPAKPKPKSNSKSFSDMVSMFNNEEFINNITPKICDMIQPLIQQTIQSTVTAAVETVKTTVLSEILESNLKFQQTVDEQVRTIAEQNTVIESQKKEIDSNRLRIDELEGENHFLAREMDSVNSELEALKLEVNRLEQYGRRSSLRFNNMNIDLHMKEWEMTRYMTSFINDNVLKGPDCIKLSEADIDRCHPVGKPAGKKKPQIIVKFFSYKAKDCVYRNKSNLKNHPDKTFVTEDLTKANHQAVKVLLKLKKMNKINSFWTTDGKILVKSTSDGQPFPVSPSSVKTKFSTQLEEIDNGEQRDDTMDGVEVAERGAASV